VISLSDIREIEKPNRSGNSANSFFKSVDLPVPEGPETTIGLAIDIVWRV
jgi:hypothetical protein